MSVFNPELAVQVLVHAAYHGDKAASEKFGITTRTVENHRARLASDAHLSELFKTAMRRTDRGIRGLRHNILRIALTKQGELIQMASTIEHLPVVTQAIQAMNETELTMRALNVDDEDAHEGEGASEASADHAETSPPVH